MRTFALLLLSLLVSVAASARTEIKISTLYPPGSDAAKSLIELSDKLKEKTNGEVLIKLYPGGVMGDDNTVMRKMRIGQLQGALVSSGTLDIIKADVKGLSRPFAFDSIDEVYAKRESYDQVIRDELLELNWLAYGPFDGGFSYLMSKKPVTSMDEIRQSKLWLPNTTDIQQVSAELNVDYLVMNIGDVLTGLDTGAIDTLVSPPSAALALNWYSRFNYVVDTPVLYTWGILILPEKTLARMDEKTRALVTSEFESWAASLEARLRVGNANANDAIRQLLKPIAFSARDIEMLRAAEQSHSSAY
ncbi:TRAP transporter substrate-binding protein DctP [Reinekea marinisedimentorum]|uniref:TRAP-type C4-dicarboxylate transport system substrate-binding protein n=1 Tax=Reinekea marinisedimentorum TaxID=230495 RepID=A0A4R3IGE0_9GAMM|nr:TRAP transporter substrate-binding protein DctP [Reinekea marinisedimentorum]TCS44082.1 TRAP-type C4-dicarboxylate transport system substrate-binding protein [Reinekea marinisedimentorum]